MGYQDYTGQFYAMPFLLDGLAGLVDFTNLEEEYNINDNSEEADYDATCSDWNAVGKDILTSISLFESEQKK